MNAFRNGAQYLDEWQGDLQQVVREGTLTDIYGIGKGIASVVTELVRMGKSEKYDKLRGAYPEGFLELFRVPGLGMKKIKALHAALGVDSLDNLEQAAKHGQIRALKGFGTKTCVVPS